MPITTFKNSVTCSATGHRNEEEGHDLPQKLARRTVVNLTLTQTASIPATTLYRVLCFCPYPNSIQDPDGMAEVVTGQKNVRALSGARRQALSRGMSLQRLSGHEARQQPHHVVAHQFRAFEVVAGGTRSVEFVLEFFGVRPSPPGLVLSDITCNCYTHIF